MDIKILTSEKNTLEMELGGVDQSLAQLIAEKLNEDSSIEFAACKMEHPLIGSPKLFVRTKKGDSTKLVLEKLEEIKKDLTTFKNEFLSITK